MREERRPLLIEAVTYRFRGHSMADPEDYRTKEEVAEWRERDPIPAFGDLLEREGMLTAEQREQIDRDAMRRVERGRRVRRGLALPRPGDAVRGRVRDRRAGPRPLPRDGELGRRSNRAAHRRACRGRRDRAALPRRFETGAARGDAARRERGLARRGHRRVRRRLQGHLRPARGVRRAARARHPHLREHDRRAWASARRWSACARWWS